VVEVAVGAVALSSGSLLLIERGRPPDAGRWSLPGGRVRAGERLSEAVEREVLEETGLVVRCRDLVGWAERISHEYHFVIFDFYVDAPATLEVVAAGDDAAAARWVPLAEVGTLDLAGGLLDFLSEHGVIPAS
jgi:8-oxo-dGTP diphosphatase